MLTASALAFFGWRALLGVVVTGVAATLVYAVLAWGLRNVRSQRRVDSIRHTLAMGLLLGLALPVLTDLRLAAVVGAALGVVAHWVGRTHWLRAHPVAVVMVVLLLAGVVFGEAWPWRVQSGLLGAQGQILRPNRMVLGDVKEAGRADAAADRATDAGTDATPENVATTEPTATAPATSSAFTYWWQLPAERGQADALRRPTPAWQYCASSSRLSARRGTFREALRRGELRPLVEVVPGMVPGAVGGVSVILLVLAGLALMHQRLARLSVVILALLGAVAALLVLPVHGQGGWTWALTPLAEMRAPLAVTFLGYGLLALPLPMIVLVLAPDGQPFSALGRSIYGLLLGFGAVAAVWWLHRPEAAYLALLGVGLLARPLDRLRRERFG